VTDERIPFHRPSLGEAERAAVLEVLDSGWLTTGPRVAAFESAFAAATGVPHAVAVNSATAALHLALEGLGVGDGDEVIVPTYTFAASAEVALYLRARPVLVDVDPVTANVVPAAVAEARTDRTRAIEVVHVAGLPADLPGLIDAAGTVPLLEDAAHAFPSPISASGGRLAGTIGRAGAFSFYATKTITTGEGGMLVTMDDALADRARSMRLHGIGRDAWKRYAAAGSWYYEIEAAGFKANLTDLAAAVGLVQLARAGAMRDARCRIARRYLDGLADAARDGLAVLPTGAADAGHAWHLFMLRLGPNARARDIADESLPGVAGLPSTLRAVASRRARMIAELESGGIGASVHFIPLHLHPLYRTMGYRAGQFPSAETIYASEVSLPIWPGMTDAQVDRVIDAVLAALRG
jgi:perosamine synthetase